MNNMAITPYISLHALQIQNVKRDVVKKINIQTLNTPLSKSETTIETNDTENLEDKTEIPVVEIEGTNIKSLPNSELIEES